MAQDSARRPLAAGEQRRAPRPFTLTIRSQRGQGTTVAVRVDSREVSDAIA